MYFSFPCSLVLLVPDKIKLSTCFLYFLFSKKHLILSIAAGVTLEDPHTEDLSQEVRGFIFSRILVCVFNFSYFKLINEVKQSFYWIFFWNWKLEFLLEIIALEHNRNMIKATQYMYLLMTLWTLLFRKEITMLPIKINVDKLYWLHKEVLGR